MAALPWLVHGGEVEAVDGKGGVGGALGEGGGEGIGRDVE